MPAAAAGWIIEEEEELSAVEDAFHVPYVAFKLERAKMFSVLLFEGELLRYSGK